MSRLHQKSNHFNLKKIVNILLYKWESYFIFRIHFGHTRRLVMSVLDFGWWAFQFVSPNPPSLFVTLPSIEISLVALIFHATKKKISRNFFHATLKLNLTINAKISSPRKTLMYLRIVMQSDKI